MPTRAVVPIADIGGRMPRAGKIKLGVKVKGSGGKKDSLRSINEFRFLSPYQDCIEKLAEVYGGTAKPYHDPDASPPNQWEVLTNANEINVYVMPDGVNRSYQQWGKGVQLRTCDGVTTTVPVRAGEHDYDLIDTPCLCLAENKRVCDVKTFLSVILPEVPMRGSWELTTKSQYASEELTGMAQLILALGQSSYVQARLGIEQRTKATVAGTREFVVPKLSIAQTTLELQAGMAQVGAISASGTRALPVATPVAISAPRSSYDGDTEVTEGQIIDPELDELEADLRAAANFAEVDAERFMMAMRGGREHVPESDLDEAKAAWRNTLAKIDDGTLFPEGFNNDGSVRWKS